MIAERCKRCNRAECRRAALDAKLSRRSTVAEHNAASTASVECVAHAVDWRARCIAAEAVIEKADALADAADEAQGALRLERAQPLLDALAAYRLARGAR